MHRISKENYAKMTYSEEHFDSEFSEENPTKARCGRCGKIKPLVWEMSKEWYGCSKHECICNNCYLEFTKFKKEKELKESMRIYRFNCKEHNYKTDRESEYEFHIKNRHKEIFVRK